MILRTFGWSFAVTIAGLVGAFFYGSTQAFLLVGGLSVLEISLSVDITVVSAKVLDRMIPVWQKIFLTVGIAIAVFGMRLVFTVVIVAVTANMGPIEAINMALNDNERYKESMEYAYPMLAGFGGMLLLMLFL